MDNSDPNQEYNKILRKFIHDYFVRKKLSDTAAIFAHEAEVSENQEDVIDYPPQGFLLEWWSVFWAAFTSTAEGIPQTTEGPSDQSNPDANQWRSLIAFASEYLRKLHDEKRALGMPSSSHAYAGPSQQQIPDDGAQQQTTTGALGGANLGGPSFVGSMFPGFHGTSPEAGVVGAENGANSIPLQRCPLSHAERTKTRSDTGGVHSWPTVGGPSAEGVPNCMKVLGRLSISRSSPLWNCACMGFLKTSFRSVFINLPDDESRLSWLEYVHDKGNVRGPPPL